MSCETMSVEGSNFKRKKEQPEIRRGQQDSRPRQIAHACVVAALTEMDYGDDFPDTLRRSLQADYEQQTKK